MKLYEVPRGTDIVLRDEEGNELRLKYHKIDGAYAQCTDQKNNMVLIAAWVEVSING